MNAEEWGLNAMDCNISTAGVAGVDKQLSSTSAGAKR